jgi:hypothetical protein
MEFTKNGQNMKKNEFKKKRKRKKSFVPISKKCEKKEKKRK